MLMASALLTILIMIVSLPFRFLPNPIDWPVTPTLLRDFSHTVGVNFPLLIALAALWAAVYSSVVAFHDWLRGISRKGAEVLESLGQPRGLEWVARTAIVLLLATLVVGLFANMSSSNVQRPARLADYFMGEPFLFLVALVCTTLARNLKRYWRTPSIPLIALGRRRQVELQWIWAGMGPGRQFILCRNTESFPRSPKDGQVAYQGQVTTYLDTGLDPNTTYYYGLFTERSNYGIWAMATTMPAPADVMDVEIGGGPAQATIKWRNPEGLDFSSVVIRRSQIGPIRSCNDGEVAWEGKEEQFVDRPLLGERTYYYGIFTRDEEGNHSLGVSCAATPMYPDDVQQLSAESTPGMVFLKWRNPPHSELEGLTIVRSTQKPAMNPDEGEQVYRGKPKEQHKDNIVRSGTYFYTVFARYTGGGISKGAQLQIATFGFLPEVGSFRSLPQEGAIKLTWKIPSDPRLVGVRILRSSGDEQATLDKGVMVHDGKGEEVLDKAFPIGVSNRYTAITYDEEGNTSSGVQTTVSVARLSPIPEAFLFRTRYGLLLRWRNPFQEGFEKIVIKKGVNAAPSSILEGEKCFEGSGTSCKLGKGTAGATNFFALFAIYGSLGWSDGLMIQAKDVDELEPVRDFIATRGEAKAELRWRNPSNSQFAGVVVRRSTSSFPVHPGEGDLLYEGMGDEVQDGNIVRDLSYYYAVFVYDANRNFSLPAHLRVGPVGEGAIAAKQPRSLWGNLAIALKALVASVRGLFGSSRRGE